MWLCQFDISVIFFIMHFPSGNAALNTKRTTGLRNDQLIWKCHYKILGIFVSHIISKFEKFPISILTSTAP